MKILLLAAGFMIGLLALAYPESVTNMFNKNELSSEQRSLCDRFKTYRESMSTSEWMTVEGILPWQLEISEDNIRKTMTIGPEILRGQLIDLLGNPTHETSEQLIYVCGWTNGALHSIIIRVESGKVFRSEYRIKNP